MYHTPAVALVCVLVLIMQNGIYAMATAKRGFTRAAAGNSAETKSVIDETSKRTVRNLFSVCAHIQDPALYHPNWANMCQEAISDDGRKVIVATRDVKKGQALTLFPIHALGIRWLNRKKSGVRSKKENNKSSQGDSDVEFIAYDEDRDSDFLNRPGLRVRLNIPLDKDQSAYQPVLNGRDDRVLFVILDTSKEVNSGWMGGKIHSTQSTSTKSNCITLPLPGAAPLCAVIATRDIKSGDELVRSITSPAVEVVNECKEIFTKQYVPELAELKQYIEMASKTT